MSDTSVTVTPVEDSSSSASLLGARSTPAAALRIGEVRGKGDIQEYLSLLLRQEAQVYPPCKDYLEPMKAAAASSEVDPVSENWRRKLCEWAYEVVDHFNFDREVVFIALDYLDRFVSKSSCDTVVPLPKKDYQLLAVTAIYMAIKIHGEVDSNDGPRRKLRIDAFYELSRKQFNVESIEKTERIMLQALNWNVNPPTALKFVSTLLSLCPKWQGGGTTSSHSSVLGGIYDVARYLTELSVCQSSFTFTTNTSLTAYAALVCALECSNTTTTKPLPYQVRVLFLNNIAEATGFVVGDAEVLRLCQELKKLSPAMFEHSSVAAADQPMEQHEEEEEEDSLMVEDGKSSPVCVIEEQQQQQAESRRKRSRSEDSWRPISSSSSNHRNP